MNSPKRYLFPFTVFILILVLIYLFRPRIGANGVRISTRLADDFGVSINPPDSPLHGFIAIPNTPYVFCQIGYEPHTVAIIDLQKGKRILSASWYDNFDALANSINHGRSEVPEINKWLADWFQLNYIYMSNVFLMTDDSNQPLILIRFRTYNHKFELVAEKWKFLGLNSELQDLPLTSKLMPISGSNRIITLESESRVDSGKSVQTYADYFFETKEFRKKDKFQLSDSTLSVLEYHSEISMSEPGEDHQTFYVSRNFPGVIGLTTSELASVYSGDPKFITTVLNASAGEKGLIYFFVYEKIQENVQLQIIGLSIIPGPNNTLLPTFRWIGKNIPNSGGVVESFSKNGQHSFFYMIDKQLWDKEKKEQYLRFTLSRALNPDGSFGDFETVFRPLQHHSVSSICFAQNQPYDDCMLVFHDNAIWTMSFDGTHEKKVFPKETP